jgi:hypothetical protein
MDAITSAIIRTAVPTFAVIVAMVRNEKLKAALGARIDEITARLDARIESANRHPSERPPIWPGSN